MKKFILLIIIFIIMSSSGCGVINQKDSVESLDTIKKNSNQEVIPKMDEIKKLERFSHIEEIKKDSLVKDKKKEVDKYISNLNLKDLLMLCGEIGYKYPDNLEGFWTVLPYSNKIIKEINTDTYLSIILNKEYPNSFRYFMVDMLGVTRHITEENKDKFSKDLVNSDIFENKEKIMKNLRNIIKDIEESEGLQLKVLPTITDYNDDDIPLFDKIFNSDKYSETIKGHALRRVFDIDKEYAYKRINEILDNPDQFGEFEVDTAKSLGRGKD